MKKNNITDTLLKHKHPIISGVVMSWIVVWSNVAVGQEVIPPQKTVIVPQQAALPEVLPNTSAQTPLDNLTRIGSLMFEQENINLYYRVLRGTLTSEMLANEGANLPTDDELYLPDELRDKVEQTIDTILQPETPLPPSVPKPTFRLSSILYLSPESWSVWINDMRIRNIAPEQKEHHLRIVDVGEDYVECVWFAEDINLVYPEWQNHLKPLNEKNLPPKLENLSPEQIEALKEKKLNAFEKGEYKWHYVSAEGDIMLDASSDIVKIKLSLHQTFVASSLMIVEGKEATTGMNAQQQMQKLPEDTIVDGETDTLTPEPVMSDRQKSKITINATNKSAKENEVHSTSKEIDTILDDIF